MIVTKVNFADFTRDTTETYIDGRTVKSLITENVLKVLDKNDYVLGGFVTEFEKEFAKYCGIKHCIGVGNGLSALEMTLTALNIGQGDEVITVANTFNASVGAILKTGAQAVLVEPSVRDYNIDIDRIEAKIIDKTKAILPVHLFGQSVEMDKLMNVADKYKIPVVEDACQSHGSLYNGQRAGSFGIAGCFSFYPGKNLGGIGDGGAITTNNDNLANLVRKIRNYGQTKKYCHDEKPDNSRLDTIQAAALLPKLKVLDEWNARRITNADIYRRELEGVKEVVLPTERKKGEHVYHLFVIKTDKRDELEYYLEQKGVQSGIHYPVPIHLQPCFFSLGYKKGDYPLSENICDNILTLPMFPTLREEEIKYVADNIKGFYSGK